MTLTFFILSQLSLFCGTKEESLRGWSTETHLHFRAYTQTGLTEWPSHQLVSVNWPREACTQAANHFLRCAGEATSVPTHEPAVQASDLIIHQQDDTFIFQLTLEGQSVEFSRKSPCKVRGDLGGVTQSTNSGRDLNI